MSGVVLVMHNIRSCHNVGSMLRTADGLGIAKAYLTGYTPYPILPHDQRLPHVALKVDRQIHKTALGAELSVQWEYNPDITQAIQRLKHDGYTVVALEQAANAVPLHTLQPQGNIALIVGREVEGVEPEVLALVDRIVEIPMHGQKESFNVAAAAAMALYHLAYMS